MDTISSSASVAKKISPRDVFVHLLAMITLYVSAGSLIALLFQIVNRFVPDVASVCTATGCDTSLSAMRFSIASLVVVFPIYCLTTRYLNRSYVDAEKRNVRIRKWLVYFTLFAAALICIGDAVSLLYNFLGGELTLRFFFKILAIFFVAGSIFYYYLHDLRRFKPDIA